MVQFGKFKPTLKLAPQNNPINIFHINQTRERPDIVYCSKKISNLYTLKFQCNQYMCSLLSFHYSWLFQYTCTT